MATLSQSFDKAIAMHEPTLTPFARAYLGHTHAVSGRRREALDIAHEFERNTAEHVIARVEFAKLYAALGDKDAAFQLLDRAYDAKTWELMSLEVDPAWDSFRADPRFQDLVQRMGFPN